MNEPKPAPFPPDKCAVCGEPLPKSGQWPRYHSHQIRRALGEPPVSICLCDRCHEQRVQAFARALTR